MWWLLLILGVIAVPAEADYESYGCKFNDSDKLVVLKNEEPTYLEEYRRVKFGQPKPRMRFEYQRDLHEFVQNIKTVYEDVMEKYLFTDFPQFYEFYQNYEKYNWGTLQTSFEDLYNKFTFNFNRKSVSSYSFAIKLIEELLQKYEELAKHVYLVAVYENKKNPNEFIYKRSSDPRQYIISNVAVLIPVLSRRTEGVILMDMGYKSFGPTKILSESFIVTDDSKRWDLKWDSTEKFVYVDTNPLPTYFTNIYYTAKPYCSFATTTFKRQLLANTTKSIIRRNRKGDPTVSISFDVTEENPKFKMTTYEENRPPKTMDIKFHELRNMNENQQEHYDEVLSKFNNDEKYDVGIYLHRAVYISNDEKFIEEYKKFLPFFQLFNGNKRTE